MRAGERIRARCPTVVRARSNGDDESERREGRGAGVVRRDGRGGKLKVGAGEGHATLADSTHADREVLKPQGGVAGDGSLVTPVEVTLRDGGMEDCVARHSRGDLGDGGRRVGSAREELEGGGLREEGVRDRGREGLDQRHGDGGVPRLLEEVELGRGGHAVLGRDGRAHAVNERAHRGRVEGASALLLGDVDAKALRLRCEGFLANRGGSLSTGGSTGIGSGSEGSNESSLLSNISHGKL